MWHCVTMLVAAAFFAMAACDSENVPGEEPGPITTADTWSAADSGKGDDPAPIDAVDTMAPDATTNSEDDANDIDPCEFLRPYEGRCARENTDPIRYLTLSMHPEQGSECCAELSGEGSFFKGTLHGTNFPLENTSDPAWRVELDINPPFLVLRAYLDGQLDMETSYSCNADD